MNKMKKTPDFRLLGSHISSWPTLASTLFGRTPFPFNRGHPPQMSKPGFPPGLLKRREMKRKGSLALLVYSCLSKQFKFS